MLEHVPELDRQDVRDVAEVEWAMNSAIRRKSGSSSARLAEAFVIAPMIASLPA